MKILALHGCGASSDIFKLQTARFRELLPSSWTFDWLDGDVSAPTGHGLDKIFPGPYLAYFSHVSAQHLASAIELVEECIEVDGPYDGAIGFSQGASLLASVLLHRQMISPSAPAPFRFAIFLHGIVPYSPDPLLNQPLYEFMQAYARNLTDDGGDDGIDIINPEIVLDMKNHDFNSIPQFPEEALEIVRQQLSLHNPDPVFSPRIRLSDKMTPELQLNARQIDLAAIAKSKRWATSDMPRSFHPDLNPSLKINIPTGHVTGYRDHFKQSAYCLRRLCEASLAQSFEHSAAHEIPWDARSTRSIVEVIGTVAGIAGMMM